MLYSVFCTPYFVPYSGFLVYTTIKNEQNKEWNHVLDFSEATTRGVLFRMVFLEISQNSQENTCARVSFLIKLQTRPATLLKKRLWHRCFPVNFVKFLRTPFLQNTTGRLLLISDDSKYCFGFMLHFRVQDHNFYSIFHNLSNLYNYINI